MEAANFPNNLTWAFCFKNHPPLHLARPRDDSTRERRWIKGVCLHSSCNVEDRQLPFTNEETEAKRRGGVGQRLLTSDIRDENPGLQ